VRSPIALLSCLAVVASLAARPARAADRAAPVVLLPATGANVPEGELAAATDILRGDLEGTGRFRVVALGRTPGGGVPEPGPAEAAQEAREVQASLAVTLRVSRLGGASTARLAAYGPDGKLVHADQLGAATPDDLEPVLKRLARGLAESRPATETADVDTVTEREARPAPRRTANRVFGFRIDASLLGERPAGHGVGHVTGGGLFWLYDMRGFLADFSVDYQFGGGDHLLDTGLGAYLPLSRDNVSPYLGGGLSWAAVHLWDRTDAGLLVKGAAGVLIGRLSSVQLRAEGGYRVALFQLEVKGERRAVQGPYLSVGLGF
jgi:hypothetical protein